MGIVCLAEYIHEMSVPIFFEKYIIIKKKIKMSYVAVLIGALRFNSQTYCFY